ncbi:MAG: D-Ala-D-Ala carboxypeptidase family metallohydrolase [candidate division WOR-3 bacterium]
MMDMVVFLLAIKPIFVLPGETVWLPDISEAEVFPEDFTPSKFQYIYKDYLPNYEIKKGRIAYRAPEDPGYKRIPFMAGTDTALVITMLPYDSLKEGKIGGYIIGEYPDPYKGAKGEVAIRPSAYAPPKGFIVITPETETLHLSEHFTLGDFGRKWETGVYPRYIVLDPRVPLMLEALMDSLESMGLPNNIKILSGYRSPLTNRKRGRKKWSRHQYGDAVDIFVDGNDDGRMDDLNRDGKINRNDALFLAEIAEKVIHDMGTEGGIGWYRGRRQGTPFIHVDLRGFYARWKR